MNSLRQFIQGIYPISNQDFEEGIELFQELELKKGEFFVKQGETSNRIGFVKEGTLRIYSTDQAGDEVTTCFCTAHRMTSSHKSFVQQTPSNFAIQALEHTCLFSITSQNLELLYKKSEAWQMIGRKLSENEYLAMEDYAVMLNRESAKEKYKKLIQDTPRIIQIAKIQDLASYLGVTRRTLTRIREELLQE